jgi:hypothetical protein
MNLLLMSSGASPPTAKLEIVFDKLLARVASSEAFQRSPNAKVRSPTVNNTCSGMDAGRRESRKAGYQFKKIRHLNRRSFEM